MLKKLLLFCLINVSFMAYGQHLARVCVVDLSRLYREFQTDSRAVQQFERESQNVQTEINRRQDAINKLRADHATAIANNNQTEASRLETQINRQTEALRDYFAAKTQELEKMRSDLVSQQSGNFYNQLQNNIRLVAEGEGFSIVLDISNRNSGVVWSSATVDITDKVIQSLRNRTR